MVEPVPVPQELLSHCALVWQVVLAPKEQVPVAEPVPLPHAPLSQSVFL